MPTAMETAGAAVGRAKVLQLMPRPVLDAIQQLVEGNDEQRAEASIIVLKFVDVPLQNHSGNELPAEVQYVLKRLVTGLASDRLNARQGFYITLEGLLQLHPSTTAFTFATALETYSKKSRDMKPREVLSLQLGECLTYGALIRSGQVFSSSEMLRQIIPRLCEIRIGKHHFDLIATQFLVNILEKMQVDNRHDYEKHWRPLAQTVLEGNLEKLSPCAVWLRLVLVQVYPSHVPESLTPANYPLFGTIIMNTASYVPKVHPILEAVVSFLAAQSPNSDAQLVEFWEKGIQKHLANKFSPKSLHVVFTLLQLMLPKLKHGSSVTSLLSCGVVPLLMTSVSRHDHDLSLAARGLASSLLQLVTASQDEQSDMQLSVVRGLVTLPGSCRFDQLTGTKLLAQMTDLFTASTVKSYADLMLNVAKYKGKNAKQADRIYAVQVLRQLIDHPKVSSSEHFKWRVKILVEVMKMAFFSSDESDAAIRMYKDSFLKALEALVGHIMEYKAFLFEVVKKADEQLKAQTKGTSILDDNSQKLWSHVLLKLTELGREEGEQCVASKVFMVLYGQMALHLFIDVPTAQELLSEIDACHEEAKKSMKRDAKKLVAAEDTPDWVEVTTEILLSLLTQEKALFRSVAQGLFRLVCPQVTFTTLSLITDILDPAKAQKLVKKDDEGDEEDDEELEDEEEQGEEEEWVDAEEGQKGSDADSGNEDSEEDSESDEDMEEEVDETEIGKMKEKSLVELRTKMMECAGFGGEDIDLDSVPQEELDNFEKNLGPLISEYINRNSKKKKKKGAVEKLLQDEQSLSSFQTRACDLLLVYISEASNMKVMLELLPAVLYCLYMADQDKRQKDLQSRLTHILKLIGKVKKYSTFGDMTVDDLFQIMKMFLNGAKQISNNAYNNVVHDCYSHLFHCGQLLMGEEEYKKPDNSLAREYVSHMDMMFSEGTKIENYIGPCSLDLGGLWNMVELMTKCAFNVEVKPSRRVQALQFLQKLYENRSVLSERGAEYTSDKEAKLCQSLVATLSSVQNTTNGINSQYLTSILALLTAIYKHCATQATVSGFDWKDIAKALISMKENLPKKVFKNYRGQYNFFRQALSLPKVISTNVTAKSIKNEGTNNNANKGTTKKKKNGMTTLPVTAETDGTLQSESKPLNNRKQKKKSAAANKTGVAKQKKLNKKKKVGAATDRQGDQVVAAMAAAKKIDVHEVAKLLNGSS